MQTPMGSIRNSSVNIQNYVLSTQGIYMFRVIDPITAIASVCNVHILVILMAARCDLKTESLYTMYEGWNFNSGNYFFSTDTK